MGGWGGSIPAGGWRGPSPLHGVLSSEVLADGGRGCKVSQCWHIRGPSVAREVPQEVASGLKSDLCGG